MSTTHKMWALKLRIDTLEWYHQNDPGDYMVEFELNELRIEMDKLERTQKLGLVCLQGGQLSKPSPVLEAIK